MVTLGRWRLGTLMLIGAIATLGSPVHVLAAKPPLRLALLPVGQPGPYFDLTMRPGDTRSLEIEIANHGDDAVVARTYAADVYTIVNGGFGGRLRDEPRTGVTDWLDYPTELIRLPAGEGVHRSFTVVVPMAARPGDYITSLILENDDPILGHGAVGLDQVLRQAIGVVITVPGERTPALAIGAASHSAIAGRSSVAVVVGNVGNVRLRPVAAFSIFDAGGAKISHATVSMDTFYARTSTSIEVPLAALLQPGTYRVSLTLGDAAEDAWVEDVAITLVVEAPASTLNRADGAVPGLTEVIYSPDGEPIPIPIAALVLIVGLVIGLCLAGLFVAWRRGQTGPNGGLRGKPGRRGQA